MNLRVKRKDRKEERKHGIKAREQAQHSVIFLTFYRALGFLKMETLA